MLKVDPEAEPAAYISQLSRLRHLDLGLMDKECPHCHALHWIDERQETSSLSNPSWESCYKRGSVQLQLLPDPPQCLKGLLEHTDTQGCHFKDNLRQYNAAINSLCEDLSRTEMPKPVTVKSLVASPGSYIPMFREISKRCMAENQKYQENQEHDQQEKPSYIARLFSLFPVPIVEMAIRIYKSQYTVILCW